MVVDPSEEQRLVGEFAQVFVRLVGQAEKHQLRVLRGIISSNFNVKIDQFGIFYPKSLLTIISITRITLFRVISLKRYISMSCQRSPMTNLFKNMVSLYSIFFSAVLSPSLMVFLINNKKYATISCCPWSSSCGCPYWSPLFRPTWQTGNEIQHLRKHSSRCIDHLWKHIF